MNIAFFLERFSPKHHFDAASLISGNPGIGGTEYMVLLIAYLLQERNNGIDVTVLSSGTDSIAGIRQTVHVENFSDAVRHCDDNEMDYMVFCHDPKLFMNGSLAIETQHTKLIPWCHVFMNWEEADLYSRLHSYWRIVNVGKEQNDLFIDHPIYSKSEYIFNCVNTDNDSHCPGSEKEHIVTYMGSLWPFKGFHWLSEAWPEVVKEEPDAQLYVIGSGDLYGWGTNLGPFGIANPAYEAYILKPLLINGELMPSVHFMGRMGKEKEGILRKTKVGVPNPTGNTETFCLSAVEMQVSGARVVMGKCPGALDTVKNGRLIHKKKYLAKAIIKELKGNYDTASYAIDYFQSNFEHDAIAGRWERLLLEGTLPKESHSNLSYRMKWMKIVKRYVSRFFPIINKLPSIERILLAIERRFCPDKAKYLYVHDYELWQKSA